MRDAIKNFPQQFLFEPVIANAAAWTVSHRFIVAGMGGSHLGADLLRTLRPELDLLVHADYGLPPIAEDTIKSYVFVASSYSGNTEETLDAYQEARRMGMTVAAVATGGALLSCAQNDRVPYVALPKGDIQPRMATGFNLRALLKLTGEESLLAETAALAKNLDAIKWEEPGKALAGKLAGKVPVVYASGKNAALAYNWKIKFNETGKIPAFYNVVPELNHNEMTGFDVKDATQVLSERFSFIFLKDENDHPRVTRRMDMLQKLYQDRGFPVNVIDLPRLPIFEKIFSVLLLADWAALYLAKHYGVEPEQVPMVEEFKKLIA